MFQNIVFVILGLAGLYVGGRLFVDNVAALASRLGVSKLLIGLTVVALGTSLPELIVSVGSALDGRSAIVLGNVFGSNIANVGLILGASGLVLPLIVHVRMLRREIPILLLTSMLALWLALDGQVSRIDGLLLLATLAGFIIWSIITAKQTGDEPEEAGITPSITRYRGFAAEAGIIIGSLLILLVAARLTVIGASDIARSVGISDLVISITLVAVGTSLPELVTSIVAALNKQSDIAIGNVVGSNIMNVLGILGGTAMISPVPVEQEVIRIDGAIMLGFAVLLMPFLLNRRLDKRESALFIVLYGLYVVWLLAFR